MVIGSHVGIAVFIPSAPSANFVFKLNLHLPIREFHSKYGSLGFNPSGALLYIGAIGAQELWIAMAPLEYFDGSDGQTFDMKDGHGDTCLSMPHYHMMVAFWGTILAELPGRNFYIFDHSANLNRGPADFNHWTNIM